MGGNQLKSVSTYDKHGKLTSTDDTGASLIYFDSPSTYYL
jgi:hypothetical protein